MMGTSMDAKSQFLKKGIVPFLGFAIFRPEIWFVVFMVLHVTAKISNCFKMQDHENYGPNQPGRFLSVAPF